MFTSPVGMPECAPWRACRPKTLESNPCSSIVWIAPCGATGANGAANRALPAVRLWMRSEDLPLIPLIIESKHSKSPARESWCRALLWSFGSPAARHNPQTGHRRRGPRAIGRHRSTGLRSLLREGSSWGNEETGTGRDRRPPLEPDAVSSERVAAQAAITRERL